MHGPGHKQPRTNPHIAIQTDWEEERGLRVKQHSTSESSCKQLLPRLGTLTGRGKGEVIKKAMLFAGVKYKESSQTISRVLSGWLPVQPRYTAGSLSPFVQGVAIVW